MSTSGCSPGVTWRRLSPVGVELPDLPAVVAAEHREEHPLAVEVEVDVADEARRLRAEERRERRRRARTGERTHELVVVAAARQGAVALPVLRQAELRAVALRLTQQEPLEVEQRVGQQRLAPEARRSPRSPRPPRLGGLPVAAPSACFERREAILGARSSSLRDALLRAVLGRDSSRERSSTARRSAVEVQLPRGRPAPRGSGRASA